MSQHLTPDDLVDMFGANAAEAAAIAADMSIYDFEFTPFDQMARDAAMLNVLKRIDGFQQVGAHRAGIWRMAWEDVATRYRESGGQPASLEPHFIGGTPIVRLRGNYAQPVDPRFELNFFRVLRAWLFRRFITPEVRVVHEFGAGSGYNMVALAGMRPDLQLHCWDWAETAVDLVRQVSVDHNLPLASGRFDFFDPAPNMELEADSVVFTFCALEQVGARFNTFIDWLVTQRPRLVIHMEPVEEFYDDQDLFDYMALKYHRHRGYLTGLQPHLASLAAAGKAVIHHQRRLGLGSLFHEGFNLLVWSPTGLAPTGLSESSSAV